MKSLYGKFVVATLVIMVSSALIAFLVVNTYYHQKLKGQNDEKNMKIVEGLTHYIENTDSLYLSEYLETQAMTGYKFYVVDADGKEMFFGNDFRLYNLPEVAIQRVLNGEDYHGMRDLPSETFVTGFFSDELANTVGRSFDYENKRYALFLRPDIKLLFTEVHYLLSGMMFVMAIMSLMAMLVFAKKLTKPIVELTKALKQVGKEQYSAEVHINRKDEIGQLAQSFQTMTERLSENERIRKEFISDVSHDFQSPLLNIKGYADLLSNESVLEEERKNYAKIIGAETKRLSSLTQQLLFLTSLDQLTTPLERELYSVDEQLKETIRKFRWLLEEKGITLSLELEEVRFNGDRAMLEKVWENLLSNALKYTEREGLIQIQLREKLDVIEMSITDTGIGIASDKQQLVFDRFYRTDESRTREIEGTGLGLSIVEQVVNLHRGEVLVESELHVGTTFTVKLPKL